MSLHLSDFTATGHGCYDLELPDGWVLEFTRDSHGFKFWTVRRGNERMDGDGGRGQRVPEPINNLLRSMVPDAGKGA